MEFCYGTNKTSRAWAMKHYKEGTSLRAKPSSGLFVINEGDLGQLRPETTQLTSSK